MPEPASKLAGFQLPRLGKHDSSVKILHRGNIRWGIRVRFTNLFLFFLSRHLMGFLQWMQSKKCCHNFILYTLRQEMNQSKNMCHWGNYHLKKGEALVKYFTAGADIDDAQERADISWWRHRVTSLKSIQKTPRDLKKNFKKMITGDNEFTSSPCYIGYLLCA